MRGAVAASREGLVAQIQRPRAGGEGRRGAGLDRAPEIRGAKVAGPRHVILRAGQVPDVAIAGTVGQPAPRHPELPAGDDILGNDRGERCARHLDADNPVPGEQGQVFLAGQLREPRIGDQRRRQDILAMQ